MSKKSGLLPLSLLVTSGILVAARITFFFATQHIQPLSLENSLRMSVGMIGFGVAIFFTSFSSLVISAAWLAKRKFESLVMGVVLAILATASCVDSAGYIIFGIAALKHQW